MLHVERRVLAPLRNHVFHDLASLNRAIAARVRKINDRPYADGTGETRYSRFESVDLPHMPGPCRTGAGSARSGEHQPRTHQRAGVEDTRTRLEQNARDSGPMSHAFVTGVMERNPNPEFGFRSC